MALALLLRTRPRARRRRTPSWPALLDQAQDELQTSLAELRELARGIHPAVLTERGLEPALQALAARAPVPGRARGRRRPTGCPAPVESAAYFVVSEALAERRQVRARRRTRRWRCGATTAAYRGGADDGVGGADAARGSGLRGLADRVAALDGTLRVAAPPGAGTRLQAEIPL